MKTFHYQKTNCILGITVLRLELLPNMLPNIWSLSDPLSHLWVHLIIMLMGMCQNVTLMLFSLCGDAQRP